jgi:hypothetical protein
MRTFSTALSHLGRRLSPNLPSTLLVGAVIAGVAISWIWLLPPIQRTDTAQLWSNAITLPLEPNQAAHQTFLAQHHGLSAITLWIAIPDPTIPSAHPGAKVRLTLIDESNGQTVVDLSLEGEQLRHNDPLLFSFPPLAQSAGRRYRFTIYGQDAGHLSLWKTDYDAYYQGVHRQGDRLQPGDLRFEIHYTLTPPEAFRSLLHILPAWLPTLMAALILTLVPGAILLHFMPGTQALDRWSRLGLAWAVGLAILPLLWQWTSALGIHWSQLGLISLALTFLIAALYTWWRRRHTLKPSGWDDLDWITLSLVLALVLSRILAVRDLAFPPLVDAPNHALLTQALITAGNIPATLNPWLEGVPFYYHPGFHALAASLQLLTGAELPHALLVLAQLLAIASPLAVAGMVTGITGKRTAGLLSLFFVGFISYLPNQYSDWGRYTHLCGTILLCAPLWLVLRPWPDHSPRWAPRVFMGILSAGLLLIHYRVFLFFVLFVIVHWILTPQVRSWWMHASWLGILLASPWIIRLIQQAILPLSTLSTRLSCHTSSYVAFPTHYAATRLEPVWLLMAALFLIWALRFRVRWSLPIASWIFLSFALANLHRIGFPATWLLTNNTWYITLFVPGGLILGWGCCRLWNWIHSPWRRWMSLAIAGIAGFLLAFGWHWSVNVIGERSVLATAADLEALHWIETNSPKNAQFLINAWPWMSQTWAAADGGGWITSLTGRGVSIPPFSYTLNKSLWRKVSSFARFVWQVGDVDDPEFLARLHQAGITNVYIGPVGQHFTPGPFLNSPNFVLRYSNGQAWVFDLAQQDLPSP